MVKAVYCVLRSENLNESGNDDRMFRILDENVAGSVEVNTRTNARCSHMLGASSNRHMK